MPVTLTNRSQTNRFPSALSRAVHPVPGVFVRLSSCSFSQKPSKRANALPVVILPEFVAVPEPWLLFDVSRGEDRTTPVYSKITNLGKGLLPPLTQVNVTVFAPPLQFGTYQRSTLPVP